MENFIIENYKLVGLLLLVLFCHKTILQMLIFCSIVLVILVVGLICASFRLYDQVVYYFRRLKAKLRSNG